MRKIYIFGSNENARSIVHWLRIADLSSSDVTAIFDYADLLEAAAPQCDGIPIQTFDAMRTSIAPEDIVLIVSTRFDDAVSDLMGLGVRHIIDGHAALTSCNKTQKLLAVVADFDVSSPAADARYRDQQSFRRYTAPAAGVQELAGGRAFIVNSMPKSGSVWMMAMVESILGSSSRHTVSLSHALDIEGELAKPNLHGVVVLVRDLRDVVVSWFHHLIRLDACNRFDAPRYPTLEDFYFNHFIGEMHASRRYGCGHLERWLNLAGSHGFPIIRYEQLVADAAAALGKVMNFWKLRVCEAELASVAREHTFESMQRSPTEHSSFIMEQLNAGHLRRGQPGAWQDELPGSIAHDIQKRFAGYQERLNYL